MCKRAGSSVLLRSNEPFGFGFFYVRSRADYQGNSSGARLAQVNTSCLPANKNNLTPIQQEIPGKRIATPDYQFPTSVLTDPKSSFGESSDGTQNHLPPLSCKTLENNFFSFILFCWQIRLLISLHCSSSFFIVHHFPGFSSISRTVIPQV